MNRSDAIRTWVEANGEMIAGDLAALIRFPTVSGSQTPEETAAFRESVSEAYGWLVRRAAAFGLRTRNLRDWALCIEVGCGDEVIGVPLHVDVVPPGEGWRHGDPFSGAIDDGEVWGRGTQDNKGPLVAVLHALAVLNGLGLPWRRRVRMIIGCGEEVGAWEDVESLRDAEGEPDLCIVPDSGFPLITGEKGWVNAVLHAHWSVPSDGAAILSLQSGDRANIVPDRAEAVFRHPERLPDALRNLHGKDAEWTSPNTLVFRGKRAHGSRPEKGVNALTHLLAHVVERCGDSLPVDQRALLSALSQTAGDTSGAGWDIARHHDFLGPTTASLNVMTLDTAGFRGTLNIRPTHGLTADETLRRVRATATAWDLPESVSVTVDPIDRCFDPFLVDEKETAESIAALESAWRSVTGTEPQRFPMSGTTYAKVFPRSIGFGPVWSEREPGLFHQIDERFPVEAQMRNVRLYAEAIGHLAL